MPLGYWTAWGGFGTPETQISYPSVEVGSHVILKGAEVGSIAGGVASIPYHLLYRRLRSVGELVSKSASGTALGATIGAGAGAALVAYKLRNFSNTEIWDRAYRLRMNSGQNKWDMAAETGTAVGAAVGVIIERSAYGGLRWGAVGMATCSLLGVTNLILNKARLRNM